MFNTNSGYSLSDIAAATGRNGSGSGWGEDGAWWIILLFMFAGWGRGGFFGGEGFGSGMNGDLAEKLLGGVVKNENIAIGSGISRILLTEHLDHHVIGGFVNERDQHLLTVDEEITVRVFFHGGRRDFPDKIPGELFGERIPQLFHIGFVHITRLG